jgi:ankyrin repeat protein
VKDGDGSTPLRRAAYYGRKDRAELLLKLKAEVNARTKGGWTPLHTAQHYEHYDVAALLRQHGGHG